MTQFRWLTAGESHGPELVALIEGCPAGLPLLAEHVNDTLARRQKGYGRGGRMKIEKDQVSFVAGVRGGETLGSPLALVVANRDYVNWEGRMGPAPFAAPPEALTRPRPGHADLAGGLKYDRHDLRDILERASARETAMRVAVGAVAQRLLAEVGISVLGHVVSIGLVTAACPELPSDERRARVLASEFACADPDIEPTMRATILETAHAGDTLGGVVEVIAEGVPPGLGSHVQWDRKLDGRLAQAIMCIQAFKGVEIGLGFEASRRRGSQVHDPIGYEAAERSFPRTSNGAGGLEGGISNGMPIVCRGAMKPIATLKKALRSVNITSKQREDAAFERSDICAVPAASVVAEAMVAIVLAEALLEKTGGDSLGEVRRNLAAFVARQREFLAMNRPLYLWGFMAAGKSTVGRLLAQQTGRSLVDTDMLVEQEAGKNIANLFRDEGEAGFRVRERRVLDQLLQDPTPRIIALGGGTLLDRPLRLRALAHGCVVTLMARPETVATRVAHRRHRPLLLGGVGTVDEIVAEAARLQGARETAYGETHGCIATDDMSARAVADIVLDVARRDEIVVAAGARSYSVRVASDDNDARPAIQRLGASAQLLITDGNVAPLIRTPWLDPAGPNEHAWILNPGESEKTLANVAAIWNAAQTHGLDRNALFVGVGGGVVTDMTGFAASVWLRGVAWMACPTTLLGMVDAAVGGKTGVDFGPAKNALGAFHQPRYVYANVCRVQTESARAYASGLAEVVKTALMGDPALFELLETQAEDILAREPSVVSAMVRACVAVKAGVVSRDENEQGERALLNLGHTIGHAIEAAGGFDRWTHGEAVSLGLVAALRLGVELGRTSASLATRVEQLLARFGLPYVLERADLDGARPFLTHDKKRQGHAVRFVLVEAIGRAVIERLPLVDVAAAMDRMIS